MTRRGTSKTAAAEQSEATNGASDGEISHARRELLEAVEETTSHGALQALFPGDATELYWQAVRSLPPAQARRFFTGLSSIVRPILEDQRFVPASVLQACSCSQEDRNDRIPYHDEGTILPDAASREYLRFLSLVARLVHKYVEAAAQKQQHLMQATTTTTKSSQVLKGVVEEVLPVAESLHSILFQLQSCGIDAQETQKSVLGLCELCWTCHLPQRELLVPRALSVIILMALDPTHPPSVLQRLWAMRHALTLIDFADGDSHDLRTLVLRLLSTPSCLKTPLGKRILTYLWHVDTNLIPHLHDTIKAQLAHRPKQSILMAYGQIYFKAWLDTTNDTDQEPSMESFRNAIEDHALSDFVHMSIYVQDHTLFKALMVVLDPFLTAKRNAHVEDLLYRLYGPILWRSLDAVNPQVRLQATTILAAVFPLTDATRTQTQNCVERACQALVQLLLDSYPLVRAAASRGMAQILTLYWDIVPTTHIRTMLQHLVSQHACDASSAPVRVAAVDAISDLLQTPKSHAVLRGLLPSFGNLIHDRVESVRLAVVRLLHVVKRTPGIKYYHVVPVEHLTARLVADAPNSPNAITAGLTLLMLNSYFPQGETVTGTQQLQRTLTFLSTDPAAAAVFYGNIAEHLPVRAVVQLMGMLSQCLESTIANEKTGHREELPAENETKQKRRKTATNQQNNNPTLSTADTAFISSLTEVIDVLWGSIEGKIVKDLDCRRSLVKAFSGRLLTDALSFFEKKASQCSDEIKRTECERICAVILKIASRLSSQEVQGMVAHVGSVLSNISTDTNAKVSAHLALLCLWGQTDEVISSLASSIESKFESYHPVLFASPAANTKKRKSGRSRQKPTAAMPALSPSVALDVVLDFLSGADPSSVAARTAILQSAKAVSILEQALEQGMKHAELILDGDWDFIQASKEDDLAFNLRVCEASGRFALHKEALTALAEITLSHEASRLLQWTTMKVLPATLTKTAAPGRESSVPFSDPNLSRISIEKSMEWSGSPIAAGPPRRRTTRNSSSIRFSGAFPDQVDRDHQWNGMACDSVRRAFATSLLSSSCVIFSEWLAVGGKGVKEICENALSWSKDCCTSDDGENSMLPYFCRLAVQLVLASQNMSLLQQLLMRCTEGEDVRASCIITKAVASLLTVRGTKSKEITESVVLCFLEATYAMIDCDSNESISFEPPSCFDDLWPRKSSLAKAAGIAFFNCRSGGLALANAMVDSVLSKDLSRARSVFHARCLWLLCDSNLSAGARDIASMMRKRVASTSVDNGSRLENMLNSLMIEIG